VIFLALADLYYCKSDAKMQIKLERSLNTALYKEEHIVLIKKLQCREKIKVFFTTSAAKRPH